jgi:hypothetical protein
LILNELDTSTVVAAVPIAPPVARFPIAVVPRSSAPESVVKPLNVLFPAILWLVVRSTKFCVLDPVPPFAIERIPATSAVARSIALVVEPEPTKFDAVNVSETKASVSAVPFHVPDVMTPVFGVMTKPLNPVAPVIAPERAREVPVAAPMFGVVRVGDVANTAAPVPVSSEREPRS